jgi:hypothetical protein
MWTSEARGVQMESPCGVFGLWARKFNLYISQLGALGGNTFSVPFLNCGKVMSHHLLTGLFLRDQTTIEIYVALFSSSFTLRHTVVHKFPFLIFQVLAEVPFLQLTLILRWAIGNVRVAN